MHDPKTYHNEDVPRFEKEVQQKMEELSFTPSDAVWANVAREVGGGKKRRRAPIFWLFFLPAFLLVGAAGIYFIGGHSGKTGTTIGGINSTASSGATGSGRELKTEKGSNNLNDQQSNSQPSNNQQPDNQQANNPQPNSELAKNTQSSKNQQPASGQSTAISQAAKIAQPAATRSGSLHHAAGKPENNKPDNNETDATTGITTAGEGTGPARTTTLTKTNEKPAINNRKATVPGKPTAGKGTAAIPDEPAAEAGEETSIGKVARINLNPVSGRNAPKITAAPLATKSLAITKTQLRPKRPWEAGFAGGIGVSSLNQALLKGSAIASYDNRNSTAAITGQPQTYISKIQPDLAFWVGILMQKPISNNLSVSTGLNLRYYSTRIYTGDKVDLTGAYSNPAGPSYNNNSMALSAITYAAAPPTSYPYYNAGDKQVFINRYYFLEIPASIQWQITHNRQMPVFWEGGFSLSYLMSSNALYYNDKAGVYYKDGDVTNKIQFNLSTALMVGIPFQGVNLQVGPQVQYGLTSLLNTQNSGQHLFYGGLKMVVIPGKSHKAGRRLFKED